MNTDQYISELSEFVAIPSVSTNPEFSEHLESAYGWVEGYCQSSGFETERWEIEGANPFLFASYVVDESLPTILIYGHYDVVYASEDDGWESDPFELVEKNERLIGRGAIDNKGQHLVHLHVIRELIQQGELAYNVKLLIEGNEETGSRSMGELLEQKKEQLACDLAVVSDSQIHDGRATVGSGVRGFGTAIITYQTADDAMHSGLYGGKIPNAAHEMSRFIARIHDDNNRITIPGMYEGVSIDVNKVFSGKTSPQLHAETGAKYSYIHDDAFSDANLFPSIEVTTFTGGYLGAGFMNAVPHMARVVLNLRYGPSQNAHKMQKRFIEWVEEITPSYITYNIDGNDCQMGAYLVGESHLYKKAVKALEDAWEQEVLYASSGGTLPIFSLLQEILDVEIAAIPFANHDCNMHGVHENFSMSCLEKALKWSEYFFSGQSKS